MAYSLKAEKVSFGYTKGKNILEEIDLSVENGEFLGILGPNGCGKSTFLKNVMNFFPPDSGVVRLFDKDIRSLSQNAIARKMGYVPQKSGMSMALTVFETILMGRLPHVKNRWEGYSERDYEITERVISDLKLNRFRNRVSVSLSGGEFQKVLLARALVQNPEILLLDEPTSNLDMNHAVELMSLVKTMTMESDLAAVAVLHDLNLAALFCDRVMFIKKGTVRYSGKPEAVFTNEIIKDIYGIDVFIGKTEAGLPYIVPVCHQICRKKEMYCNVS
ncbi:MAG TPA: ABC transporter ATP-binding protein [Thermotogota bacterium]|nr:ABC transporter ATP-binding protein [Thermotogota bacterium]HPJ88856.1 ABC transporter ATP-binding protein [Thermotogota bacterium]HPR97225.1 ABC transporter ATP-binding protein [Thermotogota bacterium]